jgi:hypothetical protein
MGRDPNVIGRKRSKNSCTYRCDRPDLDRSNPHFEALSCTSSLCKRLYIHHYYHITIVSLRSWGVGMRIWLAIVLFLLASVASAEQESLTVGRYNVSFDLGNVGPYSMNVSEKESSFLVGITIGNSSAAIAGYEATGADLDTARENVLDFLSIFNDTDITLYNRTVDGQMAVLGVASPAEGQPAFIASYPKYLGAYGTAFYVVFVSRIPWDMGTKNLLDALRVDYAPLGNVEPSANISDYGTPYYSTSDNFTEGYAPPEIHSSGGLIYNGYITFSNNGGESYDDAIVILNAKTDKEGIDSEYYYLEERFGRRGVDWDLDQQYLSDEGDRYYDVMDITLSDGRKLTIYFDITDFFGKL